MNFRLKLASFVGVLILLAVVIYLALANRQSQPHQDSKPELSSVRILDYTPRIVKESKPFSLRKIEAFYYDIEGKKAFLCEDGSTDTNRKGKPIVCKDRASYAAWLKSHKVDDKYGVNDLLKDKRVFEVDPQTECLIIKVHWFSAGMATEYEVRILEGPHEGKAVFVHYSQLCR